MQPSRATPDPPAGFVGHNLRRIANVLPQLFVGRRAALACASNRSGACAAGDLQALEQRPQQLHALAVRQAELFVHDGQRRMNPRAQLTGGRAAGRGGLQGVPTFHRLTAALADSHMHGEATIDHGPRNLGLVLCGDVRLTHPMFAATRTLRRQRHIIRFVDSRRHGPLGIRPMPASRFAAGLLRLGRRLILLAKRRGLPLAFTTQLLDQLLQFRHLRLQPPNGSPKSPIFLDQLLIARPPFRRQVMRSVSRRVHNWLYDEDPASSLASTQSFSSGR